MNVEDLSRHVILLVSTPFSLASPDIVGVMMKDAMNQDENEYENEDNNKEEDMRTKMKMRTTKRTAAGRDIDLIDLPDRCEK